MELKFKIKMKTGQWEFFELPWCYNEAFSCNLAENQIPETICQAIGLPDICNDDIYVNDVVELVEAKHKQRQFVVKFRNHQIVFYEEKTGCYFNMDAGINVFKKRLLRVGNIHD